MHFDCEGDLRVLALETMHLRPRPETRPAVVYPLGDDAIKKEKGGVNAKEIEPQKRGEGLDEF